MFGFFGPRSVNVMLVTNALAFTAATIGVLAAPQQSYRFGLDLAVHGLTLAALAFDSSLLKSVASGANLLRLGAIYADATGEEDLFGLPEAADVGLHTANLFSLS